MGIYDGYKTPREGMRWSRRWAVLWVVLSCSALPWVPASAAGGRLHTVFMILFENASWRDIQGSADAPYLNHRLLPQASYARAYRGPRHGTLHPSLPNYIWLEAGDNLGIRDDAPPAAHHLATHRHLVSLLRRAGITWRSYQQGIRGDRCPLRSHGNYRPKHNPMVYFDDVTGNNDPASRDCIRHIRPLAELGTALRAGTVARYNFISPDLCHDMHSSCAPLHNRIKQGDAWLQTWIPRIRASAAYRHGGVIFITWDEAWFSIPHCIHSDCPIGMIVLSPLAKGHGYSNSIAYDHSSTLKTVQEILGVGPLLRAAGNSETRDLRDLFARFP